MKELTAEKVLENTFNYLNDLLDKEEKTDKGRKTSETPSSSQSDNDAGIARKKEQESVAERE